MRLTLLPLMIFIDSSSTSRALSTHRSRFVSRVSSQNGALPSPSALPFSSLGHRRRRGTTNDSRRLFLGSDSNDQHQDEEQQQPIPTTIGKTEMTEILAHVENRTGDENYVVMDVRGADEIMMGTGLMSSDVKNLPLPQITSVSSWEIIVLHIFIYRYVLTNIPHLLMQRFIYTRWVPSTWVRLPLKRNSTFPNRK